MTDGMTVISNINTTHSDEFIFVPSILTDTPPSNVHYRPLPYWRSKPIKAPPNIHIYTVSQKSPPFYFSK